MNQSYPSIMMAVQSTGKHFTLFLSFASVLATAVVVYQFISIGRNAGREDINSVAPLQITTAPGSHIETVAFQQYSTNNTERAYNLSSIDSSTSTSTTAARQQQPTFKFNAEFHGSMLSQDGLKIAYLKHTGNELELYYEGDYVSDTIYIDRIFNDRIVLARTDGAKLVKYQTDLSARKNDVGEFLPSDKK